MNWDLVKEWLPALLAAIPNVVLAFQWAMRKEFATTESVLAVHKVLDDRDREQDERITLAHHRLDLLEKDLKALPDYDTVNEIKDDIVQMKEAQATGNAELRLMRETVSRIDDFLRQRA
jgi:hypothetical protein